VALSLLFAIRSRRLVIPDSTAGHAQSIESAVDMLLRAPYKSHIREQCQWA